MADVVGSLDLADNSILNFLRSRCCGIPYFRGGDYPIKYNYISDLGIHGQKFDKLLLLNERRQSYPTSESIFPASSCPVEQ